MTPRISLAITLHNHQPIGNFGWVLADVCDRAYQPMLEALRRHPGIRIGLHYSGSLLDWLGAERPRVLDVVIELAGRGQAELLGGGLYEPILVAIPDADRREQLVRLADRLQALTGVRPRGAWLAERVWEPDLPQCLADSGYEWTILDDAHFRAAGLPPDAAWTPWLTEDQGRRVAVFATDQKLRYGIPFRPVDEVLSYLRGQATEQDDRLATMGDDGEKFGGWPSTFEHCWGRGRWIEHFFEAVEANGDWLTTITPSAWLDTHPPRGPVYVPTASYAEMDEWALPAEDGVAFARVRREAAAEGRPDVAWLRGAPWRAFLVKYREANNAHKQMLRASVAVHAMAPGPTRERALDHLHRGQSNDSYWHGLFGGLYLPDLRAAAVGHLIAAQDAADAAAGYPATTTLADLDVDGRDEMLLADAGQVVIVDLAEGAGIRTWDLRAARYPVAAVLRRRPEAYHDALRALEAGAAASEAGAASLAASDPAVPTTIHGVMAAKERNLTARLAYDRHERRLGLVRLLASEVTPDEVASGTADDMGDFVHGAFEVVDVGPGRLAVERHGAAGGADGPLPLRVSKTIRLGGARRSPCLTLDLAIDNGASAAVAVRIGLELPTMLLGGGGNPAAWIEVDGRRTSHDSTGVARSIGTLKQGNDQRGVVLDASIEPPADAWWAPIETVSKSEAGFERVYQGSGLLLSWLRVLVAGERFCATLRLAAALDRDLAETAG